MFSLIAGLRARGLAVLLVEQNVVQSLGIADRGYVLEDGIFTITGAAATLLDDPRPCVQCLFWKFVMTETTSLRDRFGQPGIVVAPGCYDALSALLIEQAGFDAAYLSRGRRSPIRGSGAPISAWSSMTEVAGIRSARDPGTARLAIPSDRRCRHGVCSNALNVMRTVKLFARCGAAAINELTRRRPSAAAISPTRRWCRRRRWWGSWKAALDARPDDGVLIIARTDAIAVEGFEAALDRAGGVSWPPAPTCCSSRRRAAAELRQIGRRFPAAGRRCWPNMVEGGSTPPKSAGELEALGFSLVIFPGGTVRALGALLRRVFQQFEAARQHAALARAHGGFCRVQRHHRHPGDMLGLGRRYDAGGS